MQLYSTKEAAEYLGLSESALKYHIYIAKDLKPQKVGACLIFTQDQLDEFTKTRRPPGRPKSPPQQEN